MIDLVGDFQAAAQDRVVTPQEAWDIAWKAIVIAASSVIIGAMFALIIKAIGPEFEEEVETAEATAALPGMVEVFKMAV